MRYLIVYNKRRLPVTELALVAAQPLIALIEAVEVLLAPVISPQSRWPPCRAIVHFIIQRYGFLVKMHSGACR